MSSIEDTAAQLLDACETGQGWGPCSAFCHDDATFTAQTDALAGVETMAAYTEAMKGLLGGPLQDGSYEVKAMGVDDERNSVIIYAVFSGTHTGEGGPVPPTGNQTVTDYVYVMQFEGDRVRHMTKIWNDGFAMRQLGWG